MERRSTLHGASTMLPAVPFAYYSRLSAKQKRIYDASARLGTVPLRDPSRAKPIAEALAAALARDDRMAVQKAAAALAHELCDDLGVARPRIDVLAKRPRSRAAELHGLYTWEEGKQARIQLWMRTAVNARPAAFRTFFRTLLHEVLHHLDYVFFKLPDSYHTEGFYRRESSLVRQILGEDDPRMKRPTRAKPTKEATHTAPATTAPAKARKPPRAPAAPSPSDAPPKRKAPRRAPAPQPPAQLSLFDTVAAPPSARAPARRAPRPH